MFFIPLLCAVAPLDAGTGELAELDARGQRRGWLPLLTVGVSAGKGLGEFIDSWGGQALVERGGWRLEVVARWPIGEAERPMAAELASLALRESAEDTSPRSAPMNAAPMLAALALGQAPG